MIETFKEQLWENAQALRGNTDKIIWGAEYELLSTFCKKFELPPNIALRIFGTAPQLLTQHPVTNVPVVLDAQVLNINATWSPAAIAEIGQFHSPAAVSDLITYIAEICVLELKTKMEETVNANENRLVLFALHSGPTLTPAFVDSNSGKLRRKLFFRYASLST